MQADPAVVPTATAGFCLEKTTGQTIVREREKHGYLPHLQEVCAQQHFGRGLLKSRKQNTETPFISGIRVPG